MLSQKGRRPGRQRQFRAGKPVGRAGVFKRPGSRMLDLNEELSMGQVLVAEQVQNGVDRCSWPSREISCLERLMLHSLNNFHSEGEFFCRASRVEYRSSVAHAGLSMTRSHRSH